MDEEYLEDGAGPLTPPGDNLLLATARTEAEAYALLATTAGGVQEVDDELGLWMTDTGSDSAFGNTVQLTRPATADRQDEVVRAMRAFYRTRPAGPYLLFSPWPTGDLRQQGLHLVGHPPWMVRPAGPLPERRSDLRIEPVTDAGALRDYERVLVDGFPVAELQPWRAGCILHEAVLDTPWRFVVGYDGDRAVAGAAAYGGEASIVELIAVLPEGRGKGFGADITAAVTASDRPSVLIASDLGRPVYERLGYLPMLRYTLWAGTR